MIETRQNVGDQGLVLERLTLQHIGIPAGENRNLAEDDWNESFDKLEDYLYKDGFYDEAHCRTPLSNTW